MIPLSPVRPPAAFPSSGPDARACPPAPATHRPLPKIDTAPLPKIGMGPLPKIDAAPLPKIGTGPLPKIDAAPLPKIGTATLASTMAVSVNAPRAVNVNEAMAMNVNWPTRGLWQSRGWLCRATRRWAVNVNCRKPRLERTLCLARRRLCLDRPPPRRFRSRLPRGAEGGRAAPPVGVGGGQQGWGLNTGGGWQVKDSVTECVRVGR